MVLGVIKIHKSIRKGIKAHQYSPALQCWTVLMQVDGDVRGWLSRQSAPFHISQDGLGCRPLASIARTLAMRSCIGGGRKASGVSYTGLYGGRKSQMLEQKNKSENKITNPETKTNYKHNGKSINKITRQKTRRKLGQHGNSRYTSPMDCLLIGRHIR